MQECRSSNRVIRVICQNNQILSSRNRSPIWKGPLVFFIFVIGQGPTIQRNRSRPTIIELNPIRRFVFQRRIIQQCWLKKIRTRLNQTGQITHGRSQRNQHRVNSSFIDLKTGIQPHVSIDRTIVDLDRENIFSLHQKIRGIVQSEILSPCRQATRAVSELIMINMRFIRSHVCPRDFHPIDPGDKAVIKIDRQNHRTIRTRFRSRGIERFSDIKRRRDIVQL